MYEVIIYTLSHCLHNSWLLLIGNNNFKNYFLPIIYEKRMNLLSNKLLINSKSFFIKKIIRQSFINKIWISQYILFIIIINPSKVDGTLACKIII